MGAIANPNAGALVDPNDLTPEEKEERKRRARMGQANPIVPAMSLPPGSVVTPADQAAISQGMVRQVNNAIADEMDSRRAIAREEARMQHEKEIEAMRQTAILAKLQAEQDIARRQIAARQPDAGTKKRFNPDTMQWEPA